MTTLAHSAQASFEELAVVNQTKFAFKPFSHPSKLFAGPAQHMEKRSQELLPKHVAQLTDHVEAVCLLLWLHQVTAARV